jgi:hypothetical protein
MSLSTQPNFWYWLQTAAWSGFHDRPLVVGNPPYALRGVEIAV